ncbi:MAG: mechanosensitive ion channel family protein, partial [Bacteroidota bacterium]
MRDRLPFSMPTRLGVLLSLALLAACGDATVPAPSPTAPDSTRVETAASDSAALARLDSLRAAAAAGNSLAETGLDSMLAELDLNVVTPGSTALDTAAVGLSAADASTADASAPVADSAAVPAPAPVAAAQATPPSAAPATAQDDRLAELEGKIDSLTALVGQSLQQQRQARAAVSDSLNLAENAQNVAKAARDTVGRLGWKIFFALIVGITAFYLIRLVTFILDTLAARTAERRLFYKRLIPILRIGIWIFTAYVVISTIFGLGTNELVAAGAALGVAIGFAAQDVLKNIFGGLIIVFDQPFQVGDKIAVGGTYGEVVEIGLRSTRIVTPDDNLVSVPNAQVADGQVSNANAGALDCQVVTDLYLPGWVDVHQAKQIAYEAAATSRYVYLDKPIVVICKDAFKETFLLHLKVKAYVLDTRYEFLLMSDVTEAAKAAFRKAGLLEPMPVRSYLVEPDSPPSAADSKASPVRGDGAT